MSRRFERQWVVDVDAAVVGIARERWVSLPAGSADPEAALPIMRQSRFDVLPIDPEAGPVQEYFVTETWGCYDRVSRRRITYPDVIELETSLRDLIRMLAEDERQFYFLAEDGRVAGLVSIAHLNCRQVRVYLYALLSELERRMGSEVRARVQEDELRRAVEESTLAKRFRRDMEAGVESEPSEYLGFAELVGLASSSGLLEELDLNTPKALDERELRELRNKIAHPIKSVVGNATSVVGLWRWIGLIEEMLFGLRRLAEVDGR